MLFSGAKKRKTTVPTTRRISTTNEGNPLSNSISQDIEYSSAELSFPDELNSSITNDASVESSNNQIICPIVTDDDDDDDDDLMPVVALVEEEQPLEDLTQTDS